MKFYIIFFLSLATTFTVFAQTINNPDLVNAILDVSERKVFDVNSYEIKGSPYLEKEFTDGFIFNDSEKLSFSFQLRYNIHNDEIEIFNKADNSITALLKRPDYSCSIHNLNFKYIQFNKTNSKEVAGYFVELNGGSMRLLMKYKSKYSPEELSYNLIIPSKPPTFSISKKYYILRDDNLISLPKNKKKILELFGKYDNEVSSYIKKNKLKVRKERDITRIISYYISLSDRNNIYSSEI